MCVHESLHDSCSMVFNVHCCMSGLPGNLRGGIATVMFQLPVVRHNYAWAGCMPAGTPAPQLGQHSRSRYGEARTG